MWTERLGWREALSKVGYSRYRYSLPVTLDTYYIFPRSPTHVGPFKNAVDILVPDPREKETIVYSPCGGEVKYVVLNNTAWGPGEEFGDKLNFIHIAVGNREFLEIAHVGPLEENFMYPGKIIKAGEPIARVALNGRITMTDGKPDAHVHIMVGEWVGENGDFRSLKIRWDGETGFVPAHD